jgi:hypothetical protein
MDILRSLESEERVWGPRGDNGLERGRVRATQPATFDYDLP